MTKTRNPLSRANLSNRNLWRGFGVLGVGAGLASNPSPGLVPALAFGGLVFLSAVLLLTILYRVVTPCRVCNAGRDVPTADAWTCPYCKIGFKAAEPERKRDGAGPWE